MSKVIKFRKTSKESCSLVGFIAKSCNASESEIKRAIDLGGLWLRKAGKKKIDRFRTTNYQVRSGDYIEFNFDPSIKAGSTAKATEVSREKGYSVWFKPAGMMVQGNQFSDADSLLRVAGNRKGGAFFVNHLDKNAKGLVLIAYSKEMANKLSRMIDEYGVVRGYRALVLGHPQSFGVIETPIDGKEAVTTFSIVEKREETALVEVEVEVERLMQVRRHLAEIGHPIMGDNKYGRGNKCRDGLQLVAHSIEIPELEKFFELSVEQEKM